MAFFSEIFFSILVGKPVYTIDEKYFGNFRDFIVKRVNGNYQVTKVRIRNFRGERVIIPWNLVHSIETQPVSLTLKKSRDEIAPMDYDDDELRLKRDFLDQQIIDTNEHRIVRVNDLKIVAVKDELFMVAADIGVRGLLRRLGWELWVLSLTQIFDRSIPHVLIASQYIDPLPARVRHSITLTVAQDELKNMHPADLADIMEDLDQFERLSIIQTLPTEILAKTVAEMEPEVRTVVLSRLKDETVTKLLERLAPDAATDIVSELPKNRMRQVLTTMKTGAAAEIRELLQFKKDTAGSLMNPECVAFLKTLTVAQALDELRKKGEKAEQIFYLYIVDEEGLLQGTISLRELIFADPATPLSTLIKRKPVYARLREHVNTVAEKFTKYNLIAIPVVGKKKKLEGVITVDDILPLLIETNTSS